MDQPNWDTWRPMDATSEVWLDDLYGNRKVACVITEDFPEHSHHCVRSASKCLDGSLLIQCSCEQPFVIPTSAKLHYSQTEQHLRNKGW
jgi:hypothetical protein